MDSKEYPRAVMFCGILSPNLHSCEKDYILAQLMGTILTIAARPVQSIRVTHVIYVLINVKNSHMNNIRGCFMCHIVGNMVLLLGAISKYSVAVMDIT